MKKVLYIFIGLILILVVAAAVLRPLSRDVGVVGVEGLGLVAGEGILEREHEKKRFTLFGTRKTKII